MSRLFFKSPDADGKSRLRKGSLIALFAAFAACGGVAGYSAGALFPVGAANAHESDNTETDYLISNMVVNVPGRGILRFDATVTAPIELDEVSGLALRDEVLRISLQSGMSAIVRSSDEVIPSFTQAMETYLDHIYGADYSIEISEGLLYKAGL